MPPKFAVRFRAFCVAGALVLATAHPVHAAEPKQPPLVGLTREQVLERLGEPKNIIVAGNREVLLFDRDRVNLRDNRVVSAERVAAEPVRRPLPPPPPPVPSPSDEASGGVAETAQPAPRGTMPPPGEAMETPYSPTPVPSTEPAEPVPAAAPSRDPDAPLTIKAVRPVGYIPRTTQAVAPSLPPGAVAAPASATKAPASAENSGMPGTVPGVASIPISAPAAAQSTPPPANLPAAPAAGLADSSFADKAAAEPTDVDKEGEATPAEPPKKTRRAARASVGDELPDSTSYFDGRTYLIAAIVIGGGAAYLFWRQRQRQLEMAATAVSRTPFTTTPTSRSGSGAIFTGDLLGKLEWKRFEDLVAAYYSKTGVVAVRTKTGPASPVHIKISWKGEPRPFALVQCIAHRTGLIDATTLQELVTVLTAEDIRRGYVVSTGKFNIPARDYAEEKHITLLPGDIFLEKLNALPDAARSELMQETTAGDYTTPSCPKCEAKMVRSPDDPAGWHCIAHADQTMPVK